MKRVLVIEDDRFNRLLYRDLLEGEGWAVTVAPDGASGLAAVRAAAPDLMLVDIQLPDMSGLDLVRAIKTAHETAGIPILVVSAHALAKHRQQAAHAGADEFIQKPFEFPVFIETVRRHLESGGDS